MYSLEQQIDVALWATHLSLSLFFFFNDKMQLYPFSFTGSSNDK